MMFRFGLGLFFVSVFLFAPQLTFAQSASIIQSQIDENNRQLEALKAEIAEYQKKLNALGTQKNTLQSAISQLTLSQQQLAAQIKATQNKIRSANLQIQELSHSIGDKEEEIGIDQAAIAKALRTVAQSEESPLVVRLIATNSLNDAWKVADESVQFNRALEENIADLRAARTELATDRDEVIEKKVELELLQKDLNLQKRSVDASKAAQQKLLTDTRNQESTYQQLIAQKEAAEKAFSQELIALQGQLDLIVNPGKLPKVGSGVLSWPFPVAFMNTCAQRKGFFKNLFCITQYFGNTPFSTANPQIYNGAGHNAIDIAAPIGTPVKSALVGTVLATGNTDAYPGCYSFGKWVMVTHPNGLSTLYSHLSAIDVAKGQTVTTGQVIGLSGMTGYATGPHLHFGVYATEGTQIMQLGKFRTGVKTGCANAVMPVATLTAYLNPLSYL
jgi:murein DD-endopeptidase MepM/ murein hydrolase activator NlpD